MIQNVAIDFLWADSYKKFFLNISNLILSSCFIYLHLFGLKIQIIGKNN